MGKTRSAYPPEFRRQIVGSAIINAGEPPINKPEEAAGELEPVLSRLAPFAMWLAG